MNITWGHKITFAFIAFAAFILYMVSQMMSTKVDLVEKDYYAKELKFQQQIDKYENTRLLGDSAVIVHQNDGLIIQIKKSVPKNISVHLYYPVNNNFDKTFHFSNRSEIIISPKDIHAGKCVLKMEWTDGNKEYYFEKGIFIDQ